MWTALIEIGIAAVLVGIAWLAWPKALPAPPDAAAPAADLPRSMPPAQAGPARQASDTKDHQ